MWFLLKTYRETKPGWYFMNFFGQKYDCIKLGYIFSIFSIFFYAILGKMIWQFSPNSVESHLYIFFDIPIEISFIALFYYGLKKRIGLLLVPKIGLDIILAIQVPVEFACHRVEMPVLVEGIILACFFAFVAYIQLKCYYHMKYNLEFDFPDYYFELDEY